MEKNLQILTRFEDTASFLYVEHSVLEKKDGGIEISRGQESICLPAATLSALILGPGTSISHAAVVALAEVGVTLVWAGEEWQRFYAAGYSRSRSSTNILKQAAAWANPTQRLEVVKRLYRLRFAEPLSDALTISQIRGKEGVRVREAYAKASKDFGVPWVGRRYNRRDWSQSDSINKALSLGSAILYGICHNAIYSLGFSPAIGFIHTGKALSFVYDIADLYKTDIVIPSAFQSVASHGDRFERDLRLSIRSRIGAVRLLHRVTDDLNRLFKKSAVNNPGSEEAYPEENELGMLWGPGDIANGGVNYGGNDS